MAWIRYEETLINLASVAMFCIRQSRLDERVGFAVAAVLRESDTPARQMVYVTKPVSWDEALAELGRLEKELIACGSS